MPCIRQRCVCMCSYCYGVDDDVVGVFVCCVIARYYGGICVAFSRDADDAVNVGVGCVDGVACVLLVWLDILSLLCMVSFVFLLLLMCVC